jgi:prepilin-type N-terminal cleavage/methylation domain-containing protein
LYSVSKMEKYISKKKTFPSLKAFTLIELMIVIAIIGIATTFAIIGIKNWRENIYLSTAETNLRSLDTALKIYVTERYKYPPDENRDVPPELVKELKGESWRYSSWPDAVYDWDNWTDPVTGEKIYQFSIRFCPYQDPSSCKFPDTDWAKDFDYYSAVYYCISGPCRSHISQPIDHPGYCVNCK